MANVATLLSLDLATLQCRIENQRLTLAAYQRQADLINTILDHIDRGTIDDFCNERSRWIKDAVAEIDTMETVKKIKEMTDG